MTTLQVFRAVVVFFGLKKHPMSQVKYWFLKKRIRNLCQGLLRGYVQQFEYLGMYLIASAQIIVCNQNYNRTTVKKVVYPILIK